MSKSPQAQFSRRTDQPVVFTPTGRDQRLVTQLLTANGLECIDCHSASDLLRLAKRRCGPLVIAQEALDQGVIGQLGDLLETQPSWSELPVIVLVRPRYHSPAPIDNLIRRPGARWLRRPVDSQSLLALIRTAVEVRRRQFQVARLVGHLRQVNTRLNNRARQLQHLTSALNEAEEREQQRIGRLLHDDLQQILVGAKLHLETARRHSDQQSHPFIETVDQLIAEGIDKARNLSHQLNPPALHDTDLVGILHWIKKHAYHQYGIAVQVEVHQNVNVADRSVIGFLWRALREMFCNAAKHANVQSAHVSARHRDKVIELAVTDEGTGFDVNKVERGAGKGAFGLMSIRERIRHMGGQMTIESKLGKGSRFTLTLPIAQPAPLMQDMINHGLNQQTNDVVQS